MFRKRLSVLLFIICLGLIGCSSKEPGRYYNKEKGFSIKFPADWEKQEGYMGSTVIGLSPMESETDPIRENVNIGVEDLPKVFNMDEYYQLSIANMQQLLTGFQQQETGQTTIANINVKWFFYTFKMGKLNLKGLIYLLLKGKRAYVITCTSSPDQISKFESQFREIVQSFKFE